MSTIRLVLKGALVIAFVVTFWLVEPTAGPRLLAVAVGTVYLVAVVAGHNAPRGAPRLPAAVQGLAVGAVIGVAVAVVVVTEFPAAAYGLLFLILVLPTQFAAVLPSRWRRVVTAGWSDLARDPEPWR